MNNYSPIILQDTVTSIICTDDSLFLAGEYQDQEGIYFDFHTTPQGCSVQKWTHLVIEPTCFWSGGNRIYVDEKSNGAQNGYDWQNAFTKLSEALDVAQNFEHITEIWAAKGNYYPTIIGDRTQSFTLRNGLKIYGGFEGTENDINERSLDEKSTLSGDLGVSIDVTHNSYHVVTIDASCSNCLMDGFYVKDGNANGSLPINQQGAGIISNGTLTINNVTISNQNSILNGSDFHQEGESFLLTRNMQ